MTAAERSRELSAALLMARRSVECLIPQIAPTLHAPHHEWAWTDGGAVMVEVELRVRELHHTGAQSMIVPLPGLGCCTVTKSGRVEVST